MDDWKSDRIAACERGENPTFMVKMKSGFAVIADNQFLPGYCILLRYPQAKSLEQLSLAERSQYLIDTTLIGDAIKKVCNPRKINYSTFMNKDDYLHTHVEARYDWEPDEYKYGPSATYPNSTRYTDEHDFSEERHGELKQRLTDALIELMKQADY